MNACCIVEMIVDTVDQFLRRAETLVPSAGQRLVDDWLMGFQRISHVRRNRVFTRLADFLEGAA